MDTELDERPRVDQQLQPFTRGQLLLGVLGGDLVRAPALRNLGAAGLKVLGQRAQQAEWGSCSCQGLGSGEGSGEGPGEGPPRARGNALAACDK